jgi:hypothetical protein
MSDSLKLKGKTVYAPEVFCLIVADEAPNRLGILMFFPDYDGSERDYFGPVSFLLLDEVLGEFDKETKVGVIACFSTDLPYYKSAFPLSQLSEDFVIIYEEQFGSR